MSSSSSSSLLGRLGRRRALDEKASKLDGEGFLSGHGVSAKWLFDVWGRIARGEVDIQLARALEERKSKNLFELSFRQGETILVTDSKKYPSWKGCTKKSRKASIPAKLMHVKSKEEWTLQDIVDFVLEDFVKSTEHAPLVNSLDAASKSAKEFDGVTCVIVGRDTRFKDLVDALETFAGDKGTEQVFFWIEPLCVMADLQPEQRAELWTKQFPSALTNNKFSAGTVVVLDHYGSIPSCFSRGGIWATYCARANVQFCMSPEKRADLMTCVCNMFDQIAKWMSLVDVQSEALPYSTCCAASTSSSKDSDANEAVEEAILRVAKHEGLDRVNKKVHNLLDRWFGARYKVAFDRMAIKIPVNEASSPSSAELCEVARQAVLTGEKVALFLETHEADLEQAKEVLEKCIQFCDIAFGPTSLKLCEILVEYGKICKQVQDSEHGIAALERAQACLEKDHTSKAEEMVSSLLLSTIYEMLGEYYESAGGKKKALTLYQDKLLPKKEFLFTKDHEKVLATLQRVVALCIELNDTDKAIVNAERARLLAEKLQGENGARAGLAHIQLGMALRLKQDLVPAAEALRKGIEVRTKAMGENDAYVQQAISQLKVIQL